MVSNHLSISAVVAIGALAMSEGGAFAALGVAASDTSRRDDASYRLDFIDNLYAGDAVDASYPHHHPYQLNRASGLVSIGAMVGISLSLDRSG